MNPTDYQTAAVRTMPAGLDDHGALSMLALGVVGEWAEYEAEEERYAAQHQLREALAELAAMRGHSPEGGKKVNG